MKSKDEIKTELAAYILQEFLPGESPENLTDETPLRTSGILDSIAVVNLVTFVEKTFGIDLEAHETGIQNFDRIKDIAELIVRRTAR